MNYLHTSLMDAFSSSCILEVNEGASLREADHSANRIEEDIPPRHRSSRTRQYPHRAAGTRIAGAEEMKVFPLGPEFF